MHKFNIFFVVSCLFAQVLLGAAFDETDLDDTDRICIKDLGIDKSVVISSFDENDFIKEGITKMNDFYACAWKTDGLLKADGTIDSTNLTKMVGLKLKKQFSDHPNYRENIATESIKDCKDIKGSDNGDTCVKVYNCILRRVGEILEN